jgi:broad specificity phosphatase PhoE
MKIYVCRHGETEGNRDRILQGGSMDFPLTEKGQTQAVELGESLKDVEFDAVFCSGNQRAKDTLELMDVDCDDVEVFFEDMLREQFFGEMAGVCIDDIPAEKNKEYLADPINHAHKGGGESFVEMVERVRGFWDELNEMDYDCVLLVAHSGTMRAIEGIVNGDVQGGFEQRMKNCEVRVYER